MTRKQFFLTTLVAVFLLVGTIFVQPRQLEAREKTLKLVMSYSKGEWPIYDMAEAMANRFNERAKGQYKIVIYTGGSLAQLPEYFNSVRIGLVEMQYSNWGMFAFLDPRLSVMETPFLFNNKPATAEGGKKMLPLFDEILQEKFNAKGLNLASHGGLSIISQKPVTKIEDIEGLLVAAVSPTNAAMIKSLGAAPVTITFTDIYESLQKKVVDAVSMSADGSVNLSFTDSCKHFTPFFGTPALGGFSINLDVWKKMPPEIQQALLEETNRAGDWLNMAIQTKMVENVIGNFMKKGVTIHYLTTEERSKWEAKVAVYKNKLLNDNGELGNQVKAIADEVNKKYPYLPNSDSL